jgi:hypothetical protein
MAIGQFDPPPQHAGCSFAIALCHRLKPVTTELDRYLVAGA